MSELKILKEKGVKVIYSKYTVVERKGDKIVERTVYNTDKGEIKITREYDKKRIKPIELKYRHGI